MVKTKFNRRPKAIRSDRGREYVTGELKSFLDRNGIKMQLTAPYSPQQNGVAERKNRYIMEMARTMLIDAKMAKEFWDEAVHTVIYLQNILPSSTIGKTPYELWESQLPNLKDIHIFSCDAYVQVSKQLRGKLDAKAQLLTFVGYQQDSKAYRLVNKNTRKIKVSRDVVFVNEQLFNSGSSVEIIPEHEKGDVSADDE